MSYFPSSLPLSNPLDDIIAGYSYLYPELLGSLPTPPPLPKDEQEEEVVSEEILKKVDSNMSSPPPEFLSSQSSNIYHPYNDELMRVVTQPPVGFHNFAHYSRRVANAQAKLQMGRDSAGLITPASMAEEKTKVKQKKKKDEKKGDEKEEEEEEVVCVDEEGAADVNVGSSHLFPEELGHRCPIGEHNQPHVGKGKKLAEQYGYSDGIISHPTLNGVTSVDVSLTDGETEDLASLRVPPPPWTRSRHSCNGTEDSGKEAAAAASSSKRKRNHGDGSSHRQTVTTGRPKRSRAADIHNESERRRRDRIKEKMRELQELIPNANKMDKASMLDEAIEYLKFLQAQIQMMSMRTGMGVVSPMMLSMGMQHPQMPPISQMGLGIGMGMMDASAMVHSFKGPNSSYMPNVFHPQPTPFSTSETQYGLQSIGAMDNAVLQQQYILHLQNSLFQPQLLQGNNHGNVAMKKF